MKKILKTDEVIKTLQELRRRIEIHSMPQYSPKDADGAKFALMLSIDLFRQRLGMVFPSKETDVYLKRIWGKPSKQVQLESKAYIIKLEREANMSCGCDGGGTKCRACCAEDELKRLNRS